MTFFEVSALNITNQTDVIVYKEDGDFIVKVPHGTPVSCQPTMRDLKQILTENIIDIDIDYVVFMGFATRDEFKKSGDYVSGDSEQHRGLHLSNPNEFPFVHLISSNHKSGCVWGTKCVKESHPPVSKDDNGEFDIIKSTCGIIIVRNSEGKDFSVFVRELGDDITSCPEIIFRGEKETALGACCKRVKKQTGLDFAKPPVSVGEFELEVSYFMIPWTMKVIVFGGIARSNPWKDHQLKESSNVVITTSDEGSECNVLAVDEEYLSGDVFPLGRQYVIMAKEFMRRRRIQPIIIKNLESLNKMVFHPHVINI